MAIEHSFCRVVHIDYLVKEDGSIYLNKLFLTKGKVAGVKDHSFGSTILDDIATEVSTLKNLSNEPEGSNVPKMYNIERLNRLKLYKRFKSGIGHFDLSINFKKDELFSWLVTATDKIIQKDLSVFGNLKILNKSDLIKTNEDGEGIFEIDPTSMMIPSVLQNFINPYKFMYQRKSRVGFIRTFSVVMYSHDDGLNIIYANPLVYLSDEDFSDENKEENVIVKESFGLIQTVSKEQADLVKKMTRSTVLEVFKDLVGDDTIAYASEKDIAKVSITQKEAATYQEETSITKTLEERIVELKAKYAARKQPKQLVKEEDLKKSVEPTSA